MTTASTTPRTPYEFQVAFHDVDVTLGTLYHELRNAAADVIRKQNDLIDTADKNAEEFNRMGRPFYATVIVSRAAEYERAYSRYTTIESMFLGRASDIEFDELTAVTAIAAARQIA